MPEPIIAVTGFTGFIGQRLSAHLRAKGYRVRGIVRRAITPEAHGIEIAQVGSIDGTTEWDDALYGVDAIVHLAARTHRINERDGGSLSDYQPLNVDGTKRLAAVAAVAGVRRMVFVSSIKVNGERTTDRPYFADDLPAPLNAYGISKRVAEEELMAVASTTGLEAVIVRPPLVYGRGAKGNFARLVNAVRRGVMLPLGSVENRRSLVAVDNLADMLTICVDHPGAANQTFLVSDGEDISTPELIRRIARIVGRQTRLLPVSPGALRFAGRLAGKGAEIDRLIGSLQVDIDKTRERLKWAPPLSVDEALRRAISKCLTP